MCKNRIALLLSVVALLAYCVRLSARIPYARQTGKRCIFCHATTRPSAADLHWAGKYYAEKRTLKGYTPDETMAPGVIVERSEAAAGERTPQPGSTLKAVREVYESKCAACHGPRGKGTRGLNAGDFTDSGWQASRMDEQIRQAIEQGRPPLMPLFGDVLDEETIQGLVKTIRQFGEASQEKENTERGKDAPLPPTPNQ